MEEKRDFLHIPISRKEKSEIINFIQKMKGICEKGDLTKYTLIAWRNLMTSDYAGTHTHLNLHKTKPQDKTKVQKLMQDIAKYLLEKKSMQIKAGTIIPEKFIKEAIRIVVNIKDYRPVKDRVTMLEDHEYIVRMGTGFEFGAKKTGSGSFQVTKTGLYLDDIMDRNDRKTLDRELKQSGISN